MNLWEVPKHKKGQESQAEWICLLLPSCVIWDSHSAFLFLTNSVRGRL